jgi:chloramphenicol 3-O-phosphotransferase
MWQRMVRPDVLVFLDVDYAAAQARRPRIDWGPERLHEQAQRLAHARTHCDLYVDTSTLSREEVRRRVFDFLATVQRGGP